MNSGIELPWKEKALPYLEEVTASQLQDAEHTPLAQLF